MSFRLFIYYCAVAGGWAALAGWLLGRLLVGAMPESASGLVRAALLGASLGALVALALGFVDVLWGFAGRQMSQALLKGAVVAAIGALSGLLGGLAGQVLADVGRFGLLQTFGWALTGLLVGASVGVYDLLQRLGRGEGPAGARRKLTNGLLGGGLGGLVGGVLYWVFRLALPHLVTAKPADHLLSSGAWGFVALGVCVGLFIGLAQVMLKEAWVCVEAGFRAGRELILSKDEVTIGRAESCDIGLFGDAGVERTHARILLQDGRYLLADAGSAGGTYLNDQRLAEPAPLRDGDVIRVGGKSVLRFRERQKRK